MKSIYLTEEHDLFRQTVRQFMETQVAPHADAWEESRRIPREIWHRMGEMGFLGIRFPEEYGGSGADIFQMMVFLEELCRSRMGGFCAAVTVQEFIATAAIHLRGSEELKQRYVVPSIQGRKVGAIAISEPDAGSDVAAIRTSAVRDGDHYVLNGAKTWITNGVEGDFYVVAAKTDRNAGSGGITLIVLDSDLPGIRTSKLRKMGWHSSDTAEIVFENVRVPLSGLIGEENRGFSYIMETFATERLAAAATSVGSSVLALEETLKYMETRHAFGRPLSKFQALRHRLADLFSELEAVRQLVYHTAWLAQNGEAAVRESAMAKLLASELSKRVVDECLQFFGGFGYVEEYPMARFYRDARVSTIVAGTSEIMREIIAKIDIDGLSFGREAAVDTGTVNTRAVEPPQDLPPASALTTPPLTTPPLTPPAPPKALPESVGDVFRSLPSRLLPEKSESWRSRFHFEIKGSSTPEWTVAIEGPRCDVSEGLSGTPQCVVKTTEEVYLSIEAGTQSPETAFLLGKVKVSSPAEMIRFMKAFRRVDTV